MTASEKSFLVMFLRHVCFVVLAVVFINLFPSKADRYSETEKRISAFANHLTATLAAETFKFTSPDNPKVTVRLIENETLEFQHTELSSYRPLNTRLVFCTDNFLNICFRIFCIAALMVLVCPSPYPRTITSKLLSILSGAFCVPLIFFIRALLFGVLAHRFGVNVLGGTIDEIFRNALPFTIYIVVLRPKIPTFSKRKVQPALLLLLLSLVEGCGSALSNNHVSINLGGDNGMLYLVVAAFFAGSFFSNLTSKRKGRGETDDGEDRGRGEEEGERPEAKRDRMTAHSVVTGTSAHRYLSIEDASSIKVSTPKGVQVFKFTRASEWEVVNRFMLSLNEAANNDKGHYPVAFTSKDWNLCKGECRAFLTNFIERMPAAKKERNRKYEDWARFKVELLGGRAFR